MSTLLPGGQGVDRRPDGSLDQRGDAELISAVRAGDVAAYGELFARHVEAARRLARQLSRSDADDLVSEAFAKVLAILQRGAGPDLAFRAYLLTAVRRLHVDRLRSTARLHPTDDLTPFDPGVPFRDTAVEGFEGAAAARAFASLPERWQLVLWHTEVEGHKPADVAPLLGMSPNSVAALAYRAREGLRQAFLSMHAQDALDDGCAWTRQHLGGYVRGGLSRRDARKVETHVEECRPCAAIYLELGELNRDLGALLAPLLLGGAAAAYVGSATAGAAAAKGGLLLVLDRGRELVTAHAPATAVAGLAAGAVLGGALLVTLEGSPGGPGLEQPAREAGAPPAPRGGPPGTPGPARDREEAPGVASSDAPSGTSSSAPAAPSAGPGAPAPDTTPAPPQPDPSPDPPPGSAPPPSPEPGADLRVTASASTEGPATHRVTVTVGGPGPGGELRVSGTGSVVLTGDPRCAELAVGSGSCHVERTPTTYTFTAVAPVGGSLTFSVTGDQPDPDRADNRVTVRLA